MIKGQEVWNIHVTKGMEMRTIGNHQVCTFSDMKIIIMRFLRRQRRNFQIRLDFLTTGIEPTPMERSSDGR